MTTPGVRLFDVFICHASEDKQRFADDLDVALRERGLTCWYDSREIRVGDDFRRKMDEGLGGARFGVVIVSSHFFKYWPEAELSALFNQEATFDQTRIFPIVLDLDRTTLTTRLPLLAGRADISWGEGVDVIADRIRDAVRAGDVSTSAAVRSRLYNLPVRRVQTLFGREVDIERLLERLGPGKSVSVAASVEGLAGVGKTELALHLVDRLSRTARFPGGIFWFDAENPNLTAVWGGVIADALAAGPGSLEERAAKAVRIASNGPPVLVVLDNVEQWTNDTEPRPLPHGSHVSLLVTTRRKWLGGSSFSHHTLEVLGADAARELLASVSGRALEREDGAEKLLKHLDGHALALELAGAYLREFPSMSLGQYLGGLTAGRHAEERVSELVRYEHSVRQALDMHVGQLDRSARRALRIAACFAPEDASTSLLERCGVDPEAQQPLRRFYLITGDGERWRMHRLVRSWVEHRSTVKERTIARQAFMDGCVALARTITLENGFRVHRTDGAHLEKAVAESTQLFEEGDLRNIELLERVGIGLQSAGDLHRAEQLLEQALTLSLRHFGADHPSVASRQSNLAAVVQDLGNLPRAKELMEESLASGLGTFGADHATVATRRSKLGMVLRDLGDLTGAQGLLEQALASDLKTLDDDHPLIATRRSNLAMILRDLGDLAGATDLLEKALASDLKHFGDDHPSVAIRRCNLAVVIKSLGELPRAKELLELALTSSLKTLGADHPTVATCRFNLAQVCVGQKDLAGARALFAQALEAEERRLGADHPSTAHTRVSLAGVLFSLGEVEFARREAARGLLAVADQPTGSRYRREVEANAAEILKPDT